MRRAVLRGLLLSVAALCLLAGPPSASRARADDAGSIELPDPPPLAAVLHDAAAAHRLVFLEFYASWCGPCHEMAREVFPRPDVQAALAPFSVARYDVERGNGVEASGRYVVTGYPTIVIAFSDGTPLARVLGGIDAADLIAFLRGVSDPADVAALMAAHRDLPDVGTAPDGTQARFLVDYLQRRPGGAHAAEALDDFRLLAAAARPKELPDLLASTRAALVRRKDADDLNGLAYTAIALGYPDEALAYAKAAAALDPVSVEKQDTVAEAFYQEGLHARAIAMEQKLVTRSDDPVLKDDLARYESGFSGLPDGMLSDPDPLWDP